MCAHTSSSPQDGLHAESCLARNDLGCPIQTLIGDEIIEDGVEETEDGAFEGGVTLDFDGDGISDVEDDDDDGMEFEFGGWGSRR